MTSIKSNLPAQYRARAEQARQQAALATDEVKKRILNAGAEVVAGTPEDYAGVIDREERMWGELIRSAGLKGSQ